MPFEQPPMSPAERKPEETKKEEPMRIAFETKEGEKFFVEQLTSPEDPRVEKVQAMLAKRFGKKEVDPVETMKEAMTGRMKTGGECPRYLVTVVEDEKGKVVAMASGAAVELVSKLHDVSKDNAILLDAYTVIPQKLREKGVENHLFEMRERAALRDAESRGLKLMGYVVEDGGEDEEMYNRRGAERVYHYEGRYKLGTAKQRERYREVPYFQPPLEWDKKTGEPKKGAGVVPEHLMVKFFPDESVVGKETLMEIVRGVYLYNNEREREFFDSPKAYQNHLRFLRGIERELADDLKRVDPEMLSYERTDRLVLTDKKTRETNKRLGRAEFQEHKSEEDKEALAAEHRNAERQGRRP